MLLVTYTFDTVLIEHITRSGLGADHKIVVAIEGRLFVF